MKLLIIVFGILWTGYQLIGFGSSSPSDPTEALINKAEILHEYDRCVEEAWHDVQSSETGDTFGSPRFPVLDSCIDNRNEALRGIKTFEE